MPPKKSLFFWKKTPGGLPQTVATKLVYPLGGEAFLCQPPDDGPPSNLLLHFLWESFKKYMRPETGWFDGLKNICAPGQVGLRVLKIYAPRDRFREGFKYICTPRPVSGRILNIYPSLHIPTGGN